MHHVVVDSFDELDRLEQLHADGLPRPRVQLRITPGIEAHTHEYVRTGQADSKFGFGLAGGRGRARPSTGPGGRRPVELVGLHTHIGSQIFAAESFARAAEVMAELVAAHDLPELTLGGGLGVAYVEGESAPTITEWGKVVREALDAAGLRRAAARSSRAGPSWPAPPSRCTPSGRSRRSPASAPTSPSTAA